MVNVSAKDMGTGKEQKITITASSGLSKDEVERMMKDAESHAEEDKKRREEIETRNRADQAVYAAEKMLQEMGDKLPASDKAAVESAVEALKSAISGGDSAAMTRAMEQLTQAQHKAAEALYKTAGPQGTGGPEGQAGPGSPGSAGPQGSTGSAEGGDVIDAEVVDDK
jgi:molecular chaperone DnaK